MSEHEFDFARKTPLELQNMAIVVVSNVLRNPILWRIVQDNEATSNAYALLQGLATNKENDLVDIPVESYVRAAEGMAILMAKFPQAFIQKDEKK